MSGFKELERTAIRLLLRCMGVEVRKRRHLVLADAAQAGQASDMSRPLHPGFACRFPHHVRSL